MRTFNLGESQPSYLEDDLIKRNSSSTNSPTNWWTAVLGQQLRQRASSTPTNTTSSNINNNSHSDNVANFGGFYSSSSFSFKSAARFEDSDDLGFYAAAGGPSWLKPLLHSAAFVWLKARFAPSKLTSNLSFFIQIIAVSLIFLAFVLPAFVFLLKGRSGSKHLNRYYAPRGSSFSYSSNSLSSQENPENDAYFTEPYGAISPESGKALRDAMNGIAQSMASLTNNFIDDIQLELEPAEASNPLDLIRHRYLLYTPDNDIEYQISAFENALAMSILMNSTLVVPHLYLWALRPYGNSNAKINTHSFWKPFRQLFMESRIVERNCTLKQARDVKCMKMEHIFDLSPILNLFGKRNARLISTSDFFQEMGLQDYYLHTQGISDASIEANAWNMLEQEANILYLEDNQRHSYRFYDSSTSISQDAEINEQEADANQMPDSSRATLEFSYDNIDLQFFKTNETIMEFMKKTRSGNLRHSQIVYHQAQHSRYYNINKKKQVTPMIFQFGNLYGRYRVNYTQPHHDHHHYNIQNAIHTLLYTSNKQINSIANRIVDDLGGKYSFIGMDIQLAMPMTGIIHNEINDIIECFKDPQCVYAANTPITHHSSSTVSVTSKDIQMPNKNVLHDKVSSCLATMASSTSSSVSIPHAVFVGAELHGDPRSYPHLTVLFREVKQCLFTVYDFKYEMFGDISGTNGALVDERIPLLHFTPLVSELVHMKSFRLRHFKHVAQARRALPATSFSATSSSSASPSIKEDHQIITIQSNDFHKAVDIQNKAPNHNKNNNNHQGPVIDQNTYANEQEEHLTGRCYVHFATHGALNSQRSQLENAMMVASLLKCTLIMPYVQLGKTLTWSTFDQLSRLSHQYDRECAYASNKKVQEEGLVCSEFSDLFDLRNVMVEARLKMINVKQFSSEIGVDLSNPSSSDSENFWSLVQQSNNVVSIKDQFHGCYLMYDSHGYLSPDSEKYGAHYDRARHALDKKRDVFDVLDLNDMRLKSSLLHVATNLSTAPIRKGTTIEFHGIKRSTPAYSTIYRFGSLDGLERITLSMNQKSLRNHIHSSMIYSNKVLHSVAQGIVHKLGGSGSFVALHLRTKDQFKATLHQSIRLMIQQVQACTQQEECDLKKEGELGVLIDQTTNEKSMFLATPEARFCRRINRDSLAQDKYVIFLAADVNIEDPKANPMIAALTREFPCIYTLKDFKKEIGSFLGTLEENTTNSAGHHFHADGEVCENEYFVPLIEQLVASQSHFFVGTPGSAFSGYIHRLHDEAFDLVYDHLNTANKE